MQYPIVWARSSRFKATPICISNEWVTLVESPDESLNDSLQSLGFKYSGVNKGLNSFGYRGLLTEDEWEVIDPGCSISPFNENDIFYAASDGFRLTPDYAILLAFASKLYIRDQEEYKRCCGDYDAVEAWEILSDRDINLETVQLWSSMVSTYCISEGGDPESIDLMQEIWKSICDIQGVSPATEIPITGDITNRLIEENVVVAVAGDTVFYRIGNDEVTGKLAKTIYSFDKIALIRNSEPHWVEGSPISQTIRVPLQDVMLTPGKSQPTVEKYSHPLSLDHSLDELAPRSWGVNTEEYWVKGIEVMTRSVAHQQDVKKLIRMNDYVNQRISEVTGYNNSALYHTGNQWLIGRMNKQGYLEQIHIQGNGRVIEEKISPEDDYIQALDKYLYCYHQLKNNNLEAIERISTAGLDIGSAIKSVINDDDHTEEWFETATNESIAKVMAVRGVDLQVEAYCHRVLSETVIKSQLPWVGRIVLSEDEYNSVECYNTPDGDVLTAVSKVKSGSLAITYPIVCGNVAIANSVGEALNTFLSTEESLEISDSTLKEIQHIAEAIELHRKVNLSITLSGLERQDRSVLIDNYLLAKIRSYSPFAQCTDAWIELQADKLKHKFMNATGLIFPPRNFLFCLDLVGLTRLAVTN